jgi:endoglucanase
MLQTAHSQILNEVLSLPTAPFAEDHVHDYIRTLSRGLAGTRITHDEAGNILVRYRRGSRRVERPICLTAHTDHPGFVADRLLKRGRVKATWRGGVRPSFFRGAGVRFYVDDKWVRGRVSNVRTTGRGALQRVVNAEVTVAGDVPRGAIGMWDFPDPRTRNHRVYARGCDDLAGVAALLCCLTTLARRRVQTEAYFLFTRAEEVGFVGAVAACRAKTVPARCAVVVVETSAELPSARMGDGPILRVGDKTTTYWPPVTAFCNAVAQDLARRDRSFVYQRKLMDGGTCEAAAFCQFGYDATGICLALGNYHNMNNRTKRLGPEFVDLGDFARLVQWFVALARARRPYTGRDDSLLGRLARIEQRYASLLARTRPRG